MCFSSLLRARMPCQRRTFKTFAELGGSKDPGDDVPCSMVAAGYRARRFRGCRCYAFVKKLALGCVSEGFLGVGKLEGASGLKAAIGRTTIF